MTPARMSKRRRLETILAGGAPDRAPVALWRHWPGDDQRPDTLAAAVVDFQKRYDFDFVKVTPASSYCLVDWGARDRWNGNLEGTRDYLERVIQAPEDWRKLRPLSPRRGELARHLEALRLVGAGLPRGTPFVTTIFSPLAQARNLAGDERLRVHLRRHPDAVRAGLATIAESTASLLEAAGRSGIAGIFYAIQHASLHALAPDEYATFGLPDDLRLLAAASHWWLNIVHLHGEALMFDAACDFPAAILNWHDRDTPPDLAEGQARWPGTVCGGIGRWDPLVRGTPDDVRREVRDALRATGGRRLIVSTGCVVPIVAPTANLRAARAAVE
jgi:uroporphyrinogen decarboxylase